VEEVMNLAKKALLRLWFRGKLTKNQKPKKQERLVKENLKISLRPLQEFSQIL
jgi:hypothetical protein